MASRKLRILLAVLTLSVCATACGTGSDGDALDVSASLNDAALSSSSMSDPISIAHAETPLLQLDITNPGTEPVNVAHARLEGTLLDLIFLSYDTGIDETIAPGETRQLAFPIDFFDLDGQANGLLRGKVRLFDQDREPLAAQDTVFDVDGGAWSTMSLFTLLLAAAAIGTLAWNLLRLSQRRLPRNRFVRGVRFAYTGVAAGLAISAACSTLSIWALPTVAWLLITIIGGVIGFVLGYLTSSDDEDVIDLSDDDLYEENRVDISIRDHETISQTQT